jgi:tetratricopeptide (TPR) repeat protein
MRDKLLKRMETQVSINEWNNKGEALDESGKYNEAVECFNKALEMDPNIYYTWVKKGVTLLKLEKYTEAVECLNKALEIIPTNSELYDQAIQTRDKLLKRMETQADYHNRSLEPVGKKSRWKRIFR